MKKFAMKNVMRTAAILLCGASLALPALAQNGNAASGGQDQTQGPPPGGPHGPGGPGGRRGGPEQRLAMLTRQLDLTPDQSAKVKAILADGRAQMEAMRDDSSAQGDRHEKMMGLMKTENEKIKAVLTADQKTKLDEMEKHQRERMREHRDGDGPGGPPPPPPPPQS